MDLSPLKVEDDESTDLPDNEFSIECDTVLVHSLASMRMGSRHL